MTARGDLVAAWSPGEPRLRRERLRDRFPTACLVGNKEDWVPSSRVTGGPIQVPCFLPRPCLSINHLPSPSSQDRLSHPVIKSYRQDTMSKLRRARHGSEIVKRRRNLEHEGKEAEDTSQTGAREGGGLAGTGGGQGRLGGRGNGASASRLDGRGRRVVGVRGLGASVADD